MSGDVLGHRDLRIAKCPRCGATLSPPEYAYDDTGVELLDGPGNYWCPACGWEPPDPDYEERVTRKADR